MGKDSKKIGAAPKKINLGKSPRPVPQPSSETPSTSGGKTKK